MEASWNASDPRRDPLYVVLPVTLLYGAIFLAGLLGNVATCVVIARNRLLHTATNYYLFSLAVSDLLLLLAGLPPEVYSIWSRYPYVFGEAFCVLQGFAAETSANATVLTITAFTVERYVAICHPFQAHAMSRLSRAVRFVLLIWLLALGLAVPQASQFGVVHDPARPEHSVCTLKSVLLLHAFEVSTCVFFVAPMTLITVLYVLIGLKLRRSRLLTDAKRASIGSAADRNGVPECRVAAPQSYVIRMLVAVVVAFFICWAPFHAQRLLAVYAHKQTHEAELSSALVTFYQALTYLSGVLYYLSTAINPVLYHIMSHRFREAFKDTLSGMCGQRRTNLPHRTYSVLPRRGGCHLQEMRPLPVPISRQSSRQPPPETNLYRPRGTSISSQSTLTTSVEGNNNCRPENVADGETKRHDTVLDLITENDYNIDKTVYKQNFQNSIKKCDVRNPNPQGSMLSSPTREDAIGVLARTWALFSPHRGAENVTSNSVVCQKEAMLASHISIDSAKSTNTISNSSLQDLDDSEFIGSELAHYMGELNVMR